MVRQFLFPAVAVLLVHTNHDASHRRVRRRQIRQIRSVRWSEMRRFHSAPGTVGWSERRRRWRSLTHLPFEPWRTLRTEAARLVGRCQRREWPSRVGSGGRRPGASRRRLWLPIDTVAEIEGLSLDPRAVNARVLALNIVPRVTLLPPDTTSCRSHRRSHSRP
jgi:hypothetical protein